MNLKEFTIQAIDKGSDDVGKGSLKEFSENFTKAFNATKNLGYIAHMCI